MAEKSRNLNKIDHTDVVTFRSAPSTAATAATAPTADAPAAVVEDKKFKTRIESWLKDAETDAEKAEEYLGKKREKLKEVVGARKCKTFGHSIFQCDQMLEQKAAYIFPKVAQTVP